MSKRSRRKSKNNFKIAIRYIFESLRGKFPKVALLNIATIVLGFIGLAILHPKIDVWESVYLGFSIYSLLAIVYSAFVVFTLVFSFFVKIPDETKQSNYKTFQKILSSSLVSVIIISSFYYTHNSMTETEKCYPALPDSISNVVSSNDPEIKVLVAEFENSNTNSKPQANWLATMQKATNELNTVQVDRYNKTVLDKESAKSLAKCLGYTLVVFGTVLPYNNQDGGVITNFVFNTPTQMTFFTDEFDGDYISSTRAQLNNYSINGNGTGTYALYFVKMLFTFDRNEQLEVIKTLKEYAPTDLEERKAVGYNTVLLFEVDTYLSTLSNLELVPNLLEQAYQIDSNSYFYYLEAGFSEMKITGDYQKAYELLNQSLTLNSKFGMTYLLRGVCSFYLRNSDQALNDFKKSYEVDRGYYGAAQHSIGVVYEDLGQNQLALDAYTVAIDNDNTGTYKNRGLLYYHIYQYQKAIQDLNIAIEINDTDPHLYFYRGVSYANSYQFNLAKSDFEKVISLDSNSPEAYFQLGLLYEYENNNSQAILYYQLAINHGISEVFVRDGVPSDYLEQKIETLENGMNQ